MGMRPVPDTAPITQEYGANPSAINGPAGHSGRDYGVVTGTPVVSLVDGVVRWADWCHKLPGGPNGWEQRWFLSLSYGGIVTVIEHDDCLAVTAHLSRTDLNPGQHVAKGEIIGYSGATGLGTGPHAHTEIIPKPINYGRGSYGRVSPAGYHTEPYRPRGSTPTTPAPRKTRNGIDVSAWQPGDIASKVPADFVIVKATEGTGYVNPQLGAQVAAAKRRGKLVGLYHFASARDTSDAEAAHFLKHARPHLDAGAVAVLDWEPAGLSHYTQWAEDWMRRVDHDTGRVTLVYMNLSVSRLGTWTSFGKAHPLWVAFYGDDGGFNGYADRFDPPPVPGWRLAMWQYTQHGRLPGYAGDLDLNVYFGGITAWDKATGTATPNLDPLEEIMSWYKNRADFEHAMATAVLSYRNPKVNGNRDAYALLTEAAKNTRGLLGLVKGLPASVMGVKVTRKGKDAGTTVTPAEALAWERDNAATDRTNAEKILSILTSIEQRLTALETTKES